MAGHSKWANIKHRKGAVDAKRGKVFTRLIKEITVAARIGGGDPAANPRLRTAIAGAKSENMPKDNIERAIKKGTGELEGVEYLEITYEGYGPGGVAVLVDCMTDNKNRTVGDVRHAFSKHGGNLGESGCVGYMFDKKGSILVDKETIDEEKLMDVALEAGAEDVLEEETEFQVLTAPDDFSAVREKLEEEGVAFIEASLSMIPQNTIEVTDEKVALRLLKMLEVLEDNDDVQDVHANFDIPDEIMENLS
ncbi:MAG: YebC/PmpR family DNA-binding transcriptional regulator [Desulfobulbaceae bacterium]|uniref:Probable transcriptional regulatory protein H8E41_09450 n=1 Tax=Candidatus Desulfobia pelagia TaxID=2841692 RepID=A0A8J6NEG3_9BACT|nr:YebC/PmpR family DNA-binding transcriptional regulator [Candidatus Desulfobia pelagia]